MASVLQTFLTAMVVWYSGCAPAFVEPLLKEFAVCAGRFSALVEHHWMVDGPASDASAGTRDSLLALVEAVQDPGMEATAMGWRIEAKVAQKALLQSELQRTGEQVAQTSIFAVIAIGSISMFSIFLLITIAYVFVAIGLPTWAGFGIVALVLLITAVVTGLIAKKKAEQITPPNLSLGEAVKAKDTITAVMEQPGS